MAAGLPIVSTRVGGVSEVAPEGATAWLCEPGNAADLAAMGEAARRLAVANYGIAQMSHRYEELYRGLLGKL